jgi:uncharacterized protein (DUF2126 family)
MAPQVIRLRPAVHARTEIVSYSLKIEPEGHFLNWQQDPHGNFMARVVYPDPVDHFHVTVDLVAEMVVHNPFDFFLEPAAEQFPFEYEPALKNDLEPYLETEPMTPSVERWLKEFPHRKKTPTVDFLVALNQQLKDDIGYVIRLEPGVQTPEETLKLRSGSCRDSGWLLVQLLRHMGLASRFVSGYLIQLVPDVKSLDGPSGADRDFTDLHAWAEVFLPGAGWVGLDPTSGLLAGEGHIPLACTPHPTTAAPITGAVEKCETTFAHDMHVTRISESARVTKPYSDEQWLAIDAFGKRVDDMLKRNDVRLTIGGEPTFVAIDNPDAPEWNTTATGPNKRARAAALIEKFKQRFAPEGLLHFGQGKWYPGEPLPRWAFCLYWRADGQTIWHEPQLIADETKDYAPTPEQARDFLAGVAARLEVSGETIAPLYEDPWHFMGQERKLPENLDVATNKLDDPLARTRLARVFERGLSQPAGYVLPLQAWNAQDGSGRWRTEFWTTRSKKLFLLPGDSPIGFRLPLGSLSYVPPLEYPYANPADPMTLPLTLRETNPRRRPYRQLRIKGHDHEEARERISPQNIAPVGDGHARTALSAEPRNGRLCVFMPPVPDADAYLDLVAAIEDTCAELRLPIHIEGYDPPHDPRLNVIKVTPDPGVIEVNVHPSNSWDMLVGVTEGIYTDAHFSRLATEKFMIDGRHTGTGGGSHVVLGGATPADSPFLRRPDLLRSLLTYWQHHPALSYLFSGLFIGPTSQAPRIDEARMDSLPELELAFQQVSKLNEPAPWVVDRIFRNLLVDVSGNTHRAEICIDKLYSPDGPTGRLGLVEFRAFEMPPHSQMYLAQQLLLLSFIARFWKTPYQHSLVRWGTQLHDRFMLPHFVWQDLVDIVDDMQRAGFDISKDWFMPHFEFKFPQYGEIQYGSIGIELRQALEPWHVLGEEGAVGGTVRYVDSSVERLQVKATGLTGDRYVLGCNGMRIPMISTGREGEVVGGVRYRAWQPSASLHPTIPVDAPLVIDLYDTWSNRAVAGCTYHVAHPGGRNFETFPVNSYEAQSRRLARFFPFGHTPGPSGPPLRLERAEFPCTLDMRWGH